MTGGTPSVSASAAAACSNAGLAAAASAAATAWARPAGIEEQLVQRRRVVVLQRARRPGGRLVVLAALRSFSTIARSSDADPTLGVDPQLRIGGCMVDKPAQQRQRVTAAPQIVSEHDLGLPSVREAARAVLRRCCDASY